jgi:hypothetical protein
MSLVFIRLLWELLRRRSKPFTVRGIIEFKPVRCQKCGKPVGYVTVLGKGLDWFSKPVLKREDRFHLHGMRSEIRIGSTEKK